MRVAYRWVIVGVGALMSCVAIGAMFSLAVFLEPMSAATGWSRAGISSAMTLNFLVMGVGAFGWGAASDRFGTRIVVLIGAALLGTALVLASRATSLMQFQLTYGILVGLAASVPVLIAGLLVQALAIGTYAFVNRLGEFYALAVIFGTAYGGVMPLYAVLAREYFGQHIMGTVFGAATMLSSIGMAFGPLAGGWVFDTFDAYSWLFFGSFAVGLGAMAVAFTFQPFPRERLQPA
jgi:MFS family permease